MKIAVTRAMGMAWLALALGACSSSSTSEEPLENSGGADAGGTPDDAPATSFVACPADTRFRLVGSIDGEEVDLNEAPTSGGFSQQSNPPGPHFQIPSSTSAEEPELVAVFLTWSGTLSRGEVAPTEGIVRLPAAGPLGGNTVCAGAGSEITLPADTTTAGKVQFRLRDLRLGEDCSVAASGALAGCWRN